MCGIAGFSMSPQSKVNTRLLSHFLFREIETRGRMASGFAVTLSDGSVDLYKQDITATQLPLDRMPRNAKHGILHTRFATQGDPRDNSNNHPVVSPGANIALVHNGVIFNEGSIRRSMPDEIQALMPVVDTAVIPALIESRGSEGLKELMGDAAVAWIDQREASVLHVARVEGSPLFMTYLTDGSMVFASTLRILTMALDGAKLEHTEILEFSELDYATFTDGKLLALDKLPENKRYASMDRSWRWATSGGHGKKDDFALTTGESCSVPANRGSEASVSNFWDDIDWQDDLEDMEPMALGRGGDGWVEEAPEANCFYTLTHFGDWLTYGTVEAMVTELKTFNTLKVTELDLFPELDESYRFLERIGDIGFVDKTGQETSFVHDPRAMDEFDLPIIIRDAVAHLIKAGAAYA